MDDFRADYLYRHAPLFMKNAPQACKYTINFPMLRPGKEPPVLDFDFVTEIWWEDVDAMRAFYKSSG